MDLIDISRIIRTMSTQLPVETLLSLTRIKHTLSNNKNSNHQQNPILEVILTLSCATDNITSFAIMKESMIAMSSFLMDTRYRGVLQCYHCGQKNENSSLIPLSDNFYQNETNKCLIVFTTILSHRHPGISNLIVSTSTEADNKVTMTMLVIHSLYRLVLISEIQSDNIESQEMINIGKDIAKFPDLLTQLCKQVLHGLALPSDHNCTANWDSVRETAYVIRYLTRNVQNTHHFLGNGGMECVSKWLLTPHIELHWSCLGIISQIVCHATADPISTEAEEEQQPNTNTALHFMNLNNFEASLTQIIDTLMHILQIYSTNNKFQISEETPMMKKSKSGDHNNNEQISKIPSMTCALLHKLVFKNESAKVYIADNLHIQTLITRFLQIHSAMMQSKSQKTKFKQSRILQNESDVLLSALILIAQCQSPSVQIAFLKQNGIQLLRTLVNGSDIHYSNHNHRRVMHNTQSSHWQLAALSILVSFAKNPEMHITLAKQDLLSLFITLRNASDFENRKVATATLFDILQNENIHQYICKSEQILHWLESLSRYGVYSNHKYHASELLSHLQVLAQAKGRSLSHRAAHQSNQDTSSNSSSYIQQSSRNNSSSSSQILPKSVSHSPNSELSLLSPQSEQTYHKSHKRRRRSRTQSQPYHNYHSLIRNVRTGRSLPSASGSSRSTSGSSASLPGFMKPKLSYHLTTTPNPKQQKKRRSKRRLRRRQRLRSSSQPQISPGFMGPTWKMNEKSIISDNSDDSEDFQKPMKRRKKRRKHRQKSQGALITIPEQITKR